MTQNKYWEQYLSWLVISLLPSMDMFETIYEWMDLSKIHFICCYIILNRSCVDDEYLYNLVLKPKLGRRLGTGFIGL